MTNRTPKMARVDACRPNPVESQLRTLLGTLPVGAYICDRDGLITYFNRHAVELWGRAPALNDPIDRFCGSSRLFDVDGSPIPHERCWMALALKTGDEYNGYEIVIERDDGSRVNVLAHATPTRDESGEVVGAVNLLVDVTDRKRADDAQALLAAIVESSDDAIISKTLEGRITSWNIGAERLFGYSASEVIGRPITIIIPHDRLAEENSLLEHICQGERVEHSETVRVAKDGCHIDVSVMVSPVRDPTGRIVGASAVTRDITHRKQAEAALRESQERFQSLATNAPAAIFVKDRAGRYTVANPLACEALGRPNGAVGSTDHDLLPAEVADALRQADEQVISTRRPLEREELVRRPGFDRTYLSVKFPLLDARGQAESVCGVSIDITERKRAEEALREADRRKDEFLAMLAHELRSPLAPIRNALHILRMAEDVDPAIEKIYEILERQTNHMVRLVDDLLEVSRITHGKVELRTELVELAAVIRSAVETSRPLIDAGRHQLAISIPPEPMILEADATRLGQVVANLLNNAAKYTSAGGQIWLTAEAEHQEAVLRVRDNGMGIAPHVLPRVFEKFAQVGSADGRHGGGLGIGLTLARSLVELHGGRIEAQSEGLGKGTQFTIRLPLAAYAPRIAPPHIAPPAVNTPTKPRRILVVDDARDSAFILSSLLEALGQHVLTADNGSLAIEMAHRERPDVVISDIAMADMDGYELARRLRREPGLEGILLVALTGFGQEGDRRRTKEAGFDHHLVKPVSLKMLKGMIERPSDRQTVPAV